MITKTQKKNEVKRKLEKKEARKRKVFSHKVPTCPAEEKSMKRRAVLLINKQKIMGFKIKKLKKKRLAMNQEIDEIAKCMGLTYERGSSSAG